MTKNNSKHLVQTTPDHYLPFGEDAETCSYCDRLDPPECDVTMTSTKRKIIFLLFVASLSLTSIVLITDKLIQRHLRQSQFHEESVITFDIVAVEKWMNESDASGFGLQVNDDHNEIISDRIFWADKIEAGIPPGLSDQEIQDQIQKLRARTVTQVRPSDYLHCGRGGNRFIVFEDGSSACARNRGQSHVEFVQGELMAFYLARLLGIKNVPTVVLSQVDSPQWNQVRNASLWNDTSVVALIEWIPDLTRAVIPPLIRNALMQGNPDPIGKASGGRPDDLAELDSDQLTELAQWSDLILFDYLTGNYDRVISMMDSADRERKPAVLKETVHNLAKSTRTTSLWLLDNEASFLTAYSMLYEQPDAPEYPDKERARRLRSFHTKLLRTSCLFRRKTVKRLGALRRSSSDPASLLLRFVSDNEPVFGQSTPKIHRNSVFAQHFSRRLDEVWDWIQHCSTV